MDGYRQLVLAQRLVLSPGGSQRRSHSDVGSAGWQKRTIFLWELFGRAAVSFFGTYCFGHGSARLHRRRGGLLPATAANLCQRHFVRGTGRVWYIVLRSRGRRDYRNRSPATDRRLSSIKDSWRSGLSSATPSASASSQYPRIFGCRLFFWESSDS